MSQYVETPTRSFPAGGALGQYLRVKTPGALEVAGASDVALGVTENPAFAVGEPVAVRLSNAQGTRLMVASGAITAGNVVYAAAGGKVAASGTVIEGRALTDAGADNDIIEVQPLGSNSVSAGTVTESGTQTLTNKTLTAPAINGGTIRGTAAVLTTRVRVTAAQVNAGHTVLAAVNGYRYRLVDAVLVAVGGTTAGFDGLLVRGTQSASVVNLVDAELAALARSAVARPGAANVNVLADGASFALCDNNTAITVIKDGSNLTGATDIDVMIQYELVAN
jgi:hypothetical protein